VTIRRRPRYGRLPACVPVGITLLTAGLLAGCGGGAQHAGSSSKVLSGALGYAHCMRSHGVPDFPDPNGQGEFQLHTIFQNGVQDQAFQQALRAAVCMRANGVPNYPDPKLIDGSIDQEFNGRLPDMTAR